MRTFLCGTVVAALTSCACGGVLSLTDALPLLNKVLLVALTGITVAVGWWTIGVTRATLARLSEAWTRRQARKERRREVEASREGMQVEPVRRTSRRAHARVSPLLDEADAAVYAGDFPRALEILSDMLDEAPDHVEARLARGRIHLDLNDHARAMSDFLVAEEIAPESPEPPVAMGDLQFARKDYAQATECYDAALAILPEHAMAHCRRGMCHLYRKNYAEALDDLQRAQQLDPDIPNLAHFLAEARRKASPKPPTRRK